MTFSHLAFVKILIPNSQPRIHVCETHRRVLAQSCGGSRARACPRARRCRGHARTRCVPQPRPADSGGIAVPMCPAAGSQRAALLFARLPLPMEVMKPRWDARRSGHTGATSQRSRCDLSSSRDQNSPIPSLPLRMHSL